MLLLPGPHLRRLLRNRRPEKSPLSSAWQVTQSRVLGSCSAAARRHRHTAQPRVDAARLALDYRLPAFGSAAGFAAAGGLISFSAKYEERFQRTAALVDKVLNGTKPADIPVEQPTRFDLIINLRTARALGLTAPPALLAQATEIIE